jgi:heme A synthase
VADGSPTDEQNDRPEGRQRRAPGWREVLVVAVLVVVGVLGTAVVTSLLPPAGQDLVLRTPLAIAVLAGGTIGLLVWLARRPPVT